MAGRVLVIETVEKRESRFGKGGMRINKRNLPDIFRAFVPGEQHIEAVLALIRAVIDNPAAAELEPGV